MAGCYHFEAHTRCRRCGWLDVGICRYCASRIFLNLVPWLEVVNFCASFAWTVEILEQ